jgi:glycosyltransferase involved in cell wall biosynthesis
VKTNVTVIIPHIATRRAKLDRALASVRAQTVEPKDVLVITAEPGEYAASVRNRALVEVHSRFVAWLDDDDEMLPDHLETLLRYEDFADVVYPACRVLDAYGREIPIREEWGRPGRVFDAELLRQKSYIPVTSLVNTRLARAAGFDTREHYEDWGFYKRLLDLGARFFHVNEVTWVWHHDGGNTSGKPGKGDLA